MKYYFYIVLKYYYHIFPKIKIDNIFTFLNFLLHFLVFVNYEFNIFKAAHFYNVFSLRII